MFSIVSWSLICCYRKKEHQEEESKSEEESESEIEEETEESCIPSVDWYSSLAEEEEEINCLWRNNQLLVSWLFWKVVWENENIDE